MRMVEHSIDKIYGEPLEFANRVFEGFETSDFKSKRLREDIVHRNILFNKKLDVMNDEFDEFIGALVAQLIFQQCIIDEKRKKNVINLHGATKKKIGSQDQDE